MGAIVQGKSVEIPPQLYPYRDELGQLFEAYREAARELHEKELLEQEIFRSERLAAVGRLATGIAHEVNNPLGGMLVALDNLKQRGRLDPYVAKTTALLERGLHQIAEIVGALLVEARTQSRSLAPDDFSDIRTLIEPQINSRRLMFDWQVSISRTLALPAGMVRQILINLLLNAVQATRDGGRIGLAATSTDRELRLVVSNTGEPLSAEMQEHLFEPFMSESEGGHGLGLWVSYQAVTQLGGTIAAAWHEGEIRFTVNLPFGKESLS
jgi:signal transduction histidine kinase